MMNEIEYVTSDQNNNFMYKRGLSHNGGFSATLGKFSVSKYSRYELAKTGETGLPLATPKVCR